METTWTPIDTDFLRTAQFEEQPSFTCNVDFETKRVIGTCDEQEAMRQAIILILFTERYRWIIHSKRYGIILKDLIGQSVTYVIPIIEQRVKTALLNDKRIYDVYNFTFEKKERGALICTFDCETMFGTIKDNAVVAYV